MPRQLGTMIAFQMDAADLKLAIGLFLAEFQKWVEAQQAAGLSAARVGELVKLGWSTRAILKHYLYPLFQSRASGGVHLVPSFPVVDRPHLFQQVKDPRLGFREALGKLMKILEAETTLLASVPMPFVLTPDVDQPYAVGTAQAVAAVGGGVRTLSDPLPVAAARPVDPAPQGSPAHLGRSAVPVLDPAVSAVAGAPPVAFQYQPKGRRACKLGPLCPSKDQPEHAKDYLH